VTKLIENGNGLCLLVVNKIDLKSGLNGDLGDPEGAQGALKGLKTVKISALSGEGLDELKEALVKATLGGASISEEGSVTVTNARHYGALLRARTSLLTAAESLRTKKSNEFVAMDLRSGLDSLGEIIGEVTNDDILNQIFAKFCIGK
jgi:tRNA modification GTPase